MPWEPIHPASRRFRNSSLSFRKCKLRCSCCGNYFGRPHQKAALKYWVGCGEEGKFMLWNGIFFSRKEKLVSPTGQKHNVAFGFFPRACCPLSMPGSVGRRKIEFQKSHWAGELQAAVCEPASAGSVEPGKSWPQLPGELCTQLWCRPKARVQGHPVSCFIFFFLLPEMGWNAQETEFHVQTQIFINSYLCYSECYSTPS